MTNYEAMRTMDKDELAEFLSSIMDGEAIQMLVGKKLFKKNWRAKQ